MLDKTFFKFIGDESKCLLAKRQAITDIRQLRKDLDSMGLWQGSRTKHYPGGVVISVVAGLGTNVVTISAPPIPPEQKDEPREGQPCWCTCCLTIGKIIEHFGEFDNRGYYGQMPYPEVCANPDIAVWLYNGIRYKVEVCNHDLSDPQNPVAMKAEFIAISSDFSDYVDNEAVVVLHMGNWHNENLSNPNFIMSNCLKSVEGCYPGACAGNYPADRPQNPVWSKPDKTYIIIPVDIWGITVS